MARQFHFFFLFLILSDLVAACGNQSTGPRSQATSVAAAPAEEYSPDGMAVFRKYCVTCHGADGKLGLSGAKDLTLSSLSLDERIQIITNGKKLMTPFGELLSPAEIKAVAEYTFTLKK